jgi:hypothetical protein
MWTSNTRLGAAGLLAICLIVGTGAAPGAHKDHGA